MFLQGWIAMSHRASSTIDSVHAISDHQLLVLSSQRISAQISLVERDTLPVLAANDHDGLLANVRDDRIEPTLADDDVDQSPEIRLRRLRGRLRQSGRSPLAGTATRIGPHGEEAVLMLAFPLGIVRCTEVACSLQPA